MTLTLLAGLVMTGAQASPVSGSAEPKTTQALVDDVSQTWLAREWARYADRFVMPDGRVRDNGNGDVSHSEGQGYGLVLAATVADASRFETIWTWTKTHLLIREDGLAAWRWAPGKQDVADHNNATDGDILLAWGLWEGARRFKRDDYRQAAITIARAIGAVNIKTVQGLPILIPGAKGFAAPEQIDGPVVNLSYWVFPAFGALKDLAPEVAWNEVRRSGLVLLDHSRFGPFALPTDWESLAGPRPRPAAGFPAGFGYNAIRLPLYLALDGEDDALRALRRFADVWPLVASAADLLGAHEAPVTVPVGQPGYDLVLALARCVAGHQPISPETFNTRSDLYYPETLRLLSIVAIKERYPSCL